MTAEARITALEAQMARLLSRLPADGQLRLASRDPRLELAERILAAVAEYNGVTIEDITGPSRLYYINECRHITSWLIRNYTNWTIERIASFLNRTHGAIVIGLSRIEPRIVRSKILTAEIQTIERDLGLMKPTSDFRDATTKTK